MNCGLSGTKEYCTSTLSLRADGSRSQLLMRVTQVLDRKSRKIINVQVFGLFKVKVLAFFVFCENLANGER